MVTSYIAEEEEPSKTTKLIKVMERFNVMVKITTSEALQIAENGNYPGNPIKQVKY